MDPLGLVPLARTLVDIDSTTGREGDAARWLAAYLRARGFTVIEQAVDDERFNVFASAGAPVVVFSTHVDCVPPFFASREEDGRLFGRGSCDAKGILAAQLTAAERLRAEGDTRVGLLFVVGEERGSDGAR
ncbi:MAG TPA: M20/M25/M40 family metallo-hydrolase, partial [Vicinamibacterales bacterium]|nr:M20/M25/M40 family metallo-hydrolase [Vicinamibacterales bacterium]